MGYWNKERRILQPRPAIQSPAAIFAGSASRTGVFPGLRRWRNPLLGSTSGPQGDERRPQAKTPRGRPDGLHSEAAVAPGRDQWPTGPKGMGMRVAAETP